jgi:hypothetical protein
MTLSERIESLDLRALVPALLVAAAAFVALYLLIERFDRIARAKPVAERKWTADTGYELKFSGLEQGPFVAIETSPGGGLTVRAPIASLAGRGPMRDLRWTTPDEKEGDNKARVQVSLIGKDGSISISRSGEEVTPQLFLRVENASLEVTSGVTMGDSFTLPKTRIVADGKDLPSTGPGFTFTVPPGGFVAIEFPAFPDGSPSGVVPLLGAVREEQEDTVLPLREVELYRENADSPDKAICAAKDNKYAWAPFFRLSLFPVPHDADCSAGPLTGRGFEIDKDWVAVNLAGSGWHMDEGKPTESLWTWVGASPVLALLVNWGVPGAVAWIFGLVTWRRRAPVEPAPKAKEKAAPKPRPRSKRSR